MKLKRILLGLTLSLISIASLAGCDDANTIKVGASPAPHAEILEQCKEYIESKGYKLKIVEYTDYVQPNVALHEGELDANFFQHEPYLNGFNSDHNYNLKSVHKVHFEPLGIYRGDNGTSLSELTEGSKIAVPDDVTNCARALQLLQSYGVIEIINDKGYSTTINDCDTKGLNIIALEAGLISAQLPELSFAVINGNYAVDWDITDRLVGQENSSSNAYHNYANIIAVRSGDENSEKTKILIEALSQPEIATFISQTYGQAVVPYAYPEN